MPGRESGPDLGPSIRVWTSNDSASTPPSDNTGTRSPATTSHDPHFDGPSDDVTRQVNPGTLPAAGEEDDHDSVDAGEFDDRRNKDRDRDHDAEDDVAGSGSGDDD